MKEERDNIHSSHNSVRLINYSVNIILITDLVELRSTHIIPDLISVDINLGSTLVAGAGMTYSINLLTRGEPGIYLTRTEQERFFAEVDWGFNLNIAYFTGDPADLTKQHLSGPIQSVSGGFGFGGQGYLGFDEKGYVRWTGIGCGVGFNYGASYGSGRTYLGWW